MVRTPEVLDAPSATKNDPQECAMRSIRFSSEVADPLGRDRIPIWQYSTCASIFAYSTFPDSSTPTSQLRAPMRWRLMVFLRLVSW